MPNSAHRSLVKPFEPSSCAAACFGPKHFDSRRREIIYQAGDQRRFGADDDEIDGVIRAKANDGSMIADGKRDALGDLRNSAVPGRTIELR